RNGGIAIGIKDVLAAEMAVLRFDVRPSDACTVGSATSDAELLDATRKGDFADHDDIAIGQPCRLDAAVDAAVAAGVAVAGEAADAPSAIEHVVSDGGHGVDPRRLTFSAEGGARNRIIG